VILSSRSTSNKKKINIGKRIVDEISGAEIEFAANSSNDLPIGSEMTSFARFIESLNHQKEQEDPAFVLQPSMDDRTLPGNCHYLPPIRSDRKYTLVLDLDETLIHYMQRFNGKGKFHVRPYASYFLERMSAYYEVVIFTAALQEYADWILDQLDKKNWITHRLYRDHTLYYNNIYHKDLAALGRPLTHTIIVDNNMENFRLQPNNGIYIRSWYDDKSDEALMKLCPVLVDIAEREVSDVRVALRQLKAKGTGQGRASPLR